MEGAGDDAQSRNVRDSEDVLHSLLLPEKAASPSPLSHYIHNRAEVKMFPGCPD